MTRFNLENILRHAHCYFFTLLFLLPSITTQVLNIVTGSKYSVSIPVFVMPRYNSSKTIHEHEQINPSKYIKRWLEQLFSGTWQMRFFCSLNRGGGVQKQFYHFSFAVHCNSKQSKTNLFDTFAIPRSFNCKYLFMPQDQLRNEPKHILNSGLFLVFCRESNIVPVLFCPCGILYIK